MTNFLTYDNINWQKYFFIFDKFNDVQCIFIIPQSQSNNCLKIGTINMMNIYDITFNKILNLNQIGPFITKKELTKDYNSDNIEKSVINYFIDNKYCKWLGIVDTNLECEYKINNFLNYQELNIKNYCFIIPHRNRENDLEITKNKIYSLIKKNNILADIWIINQNNMINWNKGTTINIGFKILEKFYDYIIFNDADIYLKNNINLNEILKNTVIINNDVLHLYGYDHCLGGIFLMKKELFRKVNGFSNNFFNWGREDRDLLDRLAYYNIKINKKYINNNANEISHSNKNNFWNYKSNSVEYIIARQLYYFNQIEHYNFNLDSGLSNLHEGDFICNTKLVNIIRLKKYSNGYINLVTGENKINLQFNPESDTGELSINCNNKIRILPINPSSENIILKSTFELKEDRSYYTLELDCINKITFEINKYNQNKIEVQFNNIKKEFDLNYTPFNNNVIKYSYYQKIIDNISYNLFVNY